MSESELNNRARQGDGVAWEALIRQHQESAFRLAYLLLGDTDDAEDMAREVFIHAFRALDRFDTARPLRPWLLRITAKLARNRHRLFQASSRGSARGAALRPVARTEDVHAQQQEAAVQIAESLR